MVLDLKPKTRRNTHVKGNRMENYVKTADFRNKYCLAYKEGPMAANLFLLMCELEDMHGPLEFTEEDLSRLMNRRFGAGAREFQLGL